MLQWLLAKFPKLHYLRYPLVCWKLEQENPDFDFESIMHFAWILIDGHVKHVSQ